MISLTVSDLYDRCITFFGNRKAITYTDKSYTFNEMGENGNRLVNALQSLGLKKGDRIAFLMANCP